MNIPVKNLYCGFGIILVTFFATIITMIQFPPCAFGVGEACSGVVNHPLPWLLYIILIYLSGAVFGQLIAEIENNNSGEK